MSTTFWIQFLGIVFGLAMMYFTFVKFKRKELSNFEMMFWFAGWIILVLVAVIPSIIDFIIAPLHFYRRLDFFVVLGFFVLLGLGFYNYSIVKKVEKKIRTFVQNEALRQHEQEKNEQQKQQEIR
ncbi:DUF2304 domain-containing protein [Candidatus Woesearchaeota archaeon]|nr:DUF2304 domain-containing protein [Candidatus Woesearchaeota archaeon]